MRIDGRDIAVGEGFRTPARRPAEDAEVGFDYAAWRGLTGEPVPYGHAVFDPFSRAPGGSDVADITRLHPSAAKPSRSLAMTGINRQSPNASRLRSDVQ